MHTYKANASIAFQFNCPGSVEEAIKRAQDLLAAILDHNPPSGSYGHFKVNVEVVKSMEQSYVEKLREYPADKILALVSLESDESQDKRKSFTVNKKVYTVKMYSHRYKVFKKNSECVACGLKGTKMILERNIFDDDGFAYFNMYGVENDQDVLMTKDHIVAKAYGGKDSLDNYATMCHRCNGLKASYSLDNNAVRQLRGIVKNEDGLPKKELHKILNETRIRMQNFLNGQ